jgi:molecular chaperone DnaK
LELDRGGRLTASARVAGIEESFGQLLHLVVPSATPEALAASVTTLIERLSAVRGNLPDEEQKGLDRVARELVDTEALVDRARGGDEESVQRARRAMVDLEARIVELEAAVRWPDFASEAAEEATREGSWVMAYGNDAERALFARTERVLERAMQLHSVRDVNRHLRVMRRLGGAAFRRDPDAPLHTIEHYAARARDAQNPAQAVALVEEARRLWAKGDRAGVSAILGKLGDMIDVAEPVRRASHQSGLR